MTGPTNFTTALRSCSLQEKTNSFDPANRPSWTCDLDAHARIQAPILAPKAGSGLNALALQFVHEHVKGHDPEVFTAGGAYRNALTVAFAIAYDQQIGHFL